MRPSEALRDHRQYIRRVVESNRARNARVFGSVVRGDDLDGSDLDILIDPLPGATLLDIGGIQVELEETLGVPVDVLTPGDIPSKYRKQILESAVDV